ncbi:MAG: toll/interleukin-1 receptor domain-containing protein [Nitrospira sp.]|nr:toll/interleukin-1 receptor domain-containing protein [Nitrospira sp.]
MKPHAFVAMPFGVKKDNQGTEIDFNRVYAELIKPALEAAGLEVFRADEDMRAGEIRKDMFQELLIADLVVADLTLDNPNVWYELGVRHALRARGVVLVQGPRPYQPFDIYTDRKLRYSIKDHGPDPATLEQDRAKLMKMATATMESWHGRKISPVYNLVSNLQEPDWKSLRIGDVREFWERYEAWEARLELARKAKQIGDVLVLADEAPIAAFRAEAWIKAGETLRKAEHFTFGLEQLERGLAIEPHNLHGLREKGMCLQRLALKKMPDHSLDRARAHYRDVLEEFPNDPETWALLGRVDKDAWVSAWLQPGNTPEQMKEEAAYEDALLRAAIESYATAYRRSPGHYYSGINALTLMHLYQYLTQDVRHDKEMAMMAGAVRFAAVCERDEEKHFWSLATLGDLEILVGTPASTKAAYKEAITKNEKDWFALSSSRAQLELLKKLSFQSDNVEAGLAVFERALQKLATPEGKWQPQQVFLFSGHMIDKPGRQPPRFPMEKESVATQKIAEALEKLGAGPEDLALTQGACGGDILFTEACQQRGVKVQWLQPFDEPMFIKKSVICRGEDWRGRYLAAKGKLAAEIRSATKSLGPPPRDVDPYERCNRWLLYTALSYGIRKVQFVCLWDGAGGDGPGGTAHMYQEVNRRTGQVTWIDSHTL